jgi:hypothetical protein
VVNLGVEPITDPKMAVILVSYPEWMNEQWRERQRDRDTENALLPSINKNAGISPGPAPVHSS